MINLLYYGYYTWTYLRNENRNIFFFYPSKLLKQNIMIHLITNTLQRIIGYALGM